MDEFTIHAAALPRRYPLGLPVATIGWQPRKRELVDRRFTTYNFSFVVEGTGSYRVDDGEAIAVRASWVVTQRPEHHHRYGPLRGGRWSELFLIYDAPEAAALRARGLLAEHRHAWPLRSAAAMRDALDELRAIARGGGLEAQADRIDRICERLVVESLLTRGAPRPSGPAAAVQSIRDLVELDPERDHDFHALAREHGLSPSHFRRLWQRAVGTPPDRYRHQLLIRRACRMLVESDRAVGEIAHAVGYRDPLYFSRRFRAATGEAPSAYRARYRIAGGG